MKIAMLGAKAVPAIGGIALYVEELGSRLAARGHEVTVYCRPRFLEGGNEPYRGVRRVVTGGLSGKHLDATTHTLTSALHALKQDYDILHVHGAAPSIVAPLLRLRRRAKVVVTIHGLDWRDVKWSGAASRVMHWGARVGGATAHRVTAVSEAVREDYRRLVGIESQFVPTGAMPAELTPPEELYSLGIKPLEYVFCAARLVPRKGVHYLVDAFKNLRTDKKLVIAGSCPYEDDYVRRLRACASDRIIFAGYVKGRLLAELYSNAYLYVQPSEDEGLPISVLEAMAYGRYVLASDIPHNQEALGPCGGTFRVKDVLDLRRKLEALFAQPELVERQFEQARSFIRSERDWEVTTDLYERLYEALHNGQAESGPCAGALMPREVANHGAHLDQ